jgi:hypothetical protein
MSIFWSNKYLNIAMILQKVIRRAFVFDFCAACGTFIALIYITTILAST